MDEINNLPLVGANVLIKGTNTGVTTDINGNFKIENVPVGRVNLKILTTW